MKKFFALMLLLATMIGFSSCSKEENGIPKKVLVGTWNGVAVKSNGEWIDITKYPYSSKLGFSATFYSDGSYFGKGSLGTGSGTYKLNGNTIKTYVDGELYLTYYVISWTETSAMLTITDNSGSMDVRVEKQL